MIGKLKRRFTILATASMFILMTVLVLMMNIVNYTSVVSECDIILDVLSQPNAPFFDDKIAPDKPDIRMDDFIPPGMSPEVPYESRYFSVIVTSEGEITESDMSKIISVDDDTSKEYIEKAIESGKKRGFVKQFRYCKVSDGGTSKIFFLDCGRKLNSFRSFLLTSVLVGFTGCVIVFIAFLFAAGKIVKPIADSYEKQKRFISDAGHEIKTPLTIINANVDLLECDGDKEELTDIRQQTEKLTELTNKLVYLSKMEESEHKLQKIELPLSDIVSESANTFNAPASANDIGFEKHIEDGISIIGSPDAIRQLVSILLENAVKYTPAGGIIALDLVKVRKSAVLTVLNTTKEAITENELAYVFDRFYRTDTSRNSSTGGHGIGLSIAKAIVDAHSGSISANTRSGFDFCITASLPI